MIIFVEASTAKEFFWKIGGEKFDLILLDYGLPDLDGVEALKRLEKFSEEDIPGVLFVTAEEDPSILDRYQGDAVKGYVTKPIPVNAFIEKLELLLRKPIVENLAAIECDVDINFPRLPIETRTKLKSLRENSCVLESKLQFKPKGRFEVTIPLFDRMRDSDNTYHLVVKEVDRDRNTATVKCSFLGLTDQDTSFLRSIVIKGQSIRG